MSGATLNRAYICDPQNKIVSEIVTNPAALLTVPSSPFRKEYQLLLNDAVILEIFIKSRNKWWNQFVKAKYKQSGVESCHRAACDANRILTSQCGSEC